MKTFDRICIEDYTVTEGEISATVHCGEEYITTEERDGTVTVFTDYWIRYVPVKIFAGGLERPDPFSLVTTHPKS